MQSVNVSMTFIAPCANMPLKCVLYNFTVMFYFFCELRVYGHKFHPQRNKILFKESYYLKDSQKKMFIPYRIVGVFFNGG